MSDELEARRATKWASEAALTDAYREGYSDCAYDADEKWTARLKEATTTTRQAAADAVLAEARAMCCDADTSLSHTARAEHSRVMAIAERLAAAVRGMG